MIERQGSRYVNRVRAGTTSSRTVARLWRPVTDSWIGSADDRLWQRAEDSDLDRVEGDSWLSRRRAV